MELWIWSVLAWGGSGFFLGWISIDFRFGVASYFNVSFVSSIPW